LREYEAVEFPLGKSIALQNTESRLRDVLKDIEKAYAKQETEKGAEEWIKKLKPFVATSGKKKLIASYTADIQTIQQQQQIWLILNKMILLKLLKWITKYPSLG